MKFELVHPDAKLPTRGTDGAAGLDLYSVNKHFIVAGETELIQIGIKSEIPGGHVGVIMDKSSMGKKGLKVMGGVMDSDYRGEWFVMLHNLTQEGVEILPGKKVAQVVVMRHYCGPVIEGTVGETERGEGAFGSTGE